MASQQVTVGMMVLRVTGDRLEILIDDVAFFDVPVTCQVERVGAEERDRDVFITPPVLTAGTDCTSITWSARSTLWEKKEYVLQCWPDAAFFHVRVFGIGRLGAVRYFAASGSARSRYEVSRYLEPVAHPGGKSLPQYLTTAQDGEINLGYLAPPMLAYPFTLDGSMWLALGLAPKPGHYNIDHFRCHFFHTDSDVQPFYLSTDFLGYTVMHGQYDLPSIAITSGMTEFAALAAQTHALVSYAGHPRRDWADSPRWWYGPMFCGWGEQGYYTPKHFQTSAAQQPYSCMSDEIDELGLRPTAIIIDDKWMTNYGEALPDPEKWPDMRAFVEREHAKGRRVMLWFKAWNSEGIPADECFNLWTQPYGTDPTSPAYQERMFRLMHTLLSVDAGCYNCDGFKVDFANVMPLGHDLRGHENGVYGLELLKRWYTLFYTAAKAVKPDCLVNTSCAHPYYADVTDQGRLHDYDARLRAAWEVRSFRQKLFQAALPGISIDTDGVWSSRREIMDFNRRAVELGVPVLYQLHGDENNIFNRDDLREISGIWTDYSKRMDERYGKVILP